MNPTSGSSNEKRTLAITSLTPPSLKIDPRSSLPADQKMNISCSFGESAIFLPSVLTNISQTGACVMTENCKVSEAIRTA